MTISAGENLEKMEPSCTVGRNVNWHIQFGGFPGGSDSKESACNAGDSGSVPELGRFPGKGMATHSSILAWRVPWTEKTGGLQSMGS